MNEVRYSLVNLVRVAQSFPATPRIMARLGGLLRDPNAALDEIAAQLKHDSSLAARLLRIANSAAFAQSEPVISIEDATALIGLQDVHRLVGAVAVDQFSVRSYPLYGFSGPRLRDNAILVALLMEELAIPSREDPATAYVTGLFRSLGKLALAKIADENAPVVSLRPTDGLPLVEWEKQSFGLASNQATAAILEQWHFPGGVTRAIMEHYAPSHPGHPLACLLHLAAHLADQLGYGLPGESSYWYDPSHLSRATGLNPLQLQQASSRSLTAFDRINGALA